MIGGVTMKPIKYSLTKQIADEIEQKILNEEYKVGEKIPPEPQLIEYFKVSRNTVRESVQALINAGILEARQGDGTYVIAKERLQVDFFCLMNKTERKEVIEIRNLLEKHIVESASTNATDGDIEFIKKCLDKRNNYSERVKENTLADMNFHTAISIATHNNMLINIYSYVSQYFNKFIAESLTINYDKQQHIDELHTELYNSIKLKDGMRAKQIIDQIINL